MSTRFPYRALGRPYSGKNALVRPVQVAQVGKVETAVAVVPDAPVVVPDAPVDALDQVFDAVLADPEPLPEAAPTGPVWDPSWTKARLVAVAEALGLTVTVENTKAEIIAALKTIG